jgi:hypothetical protein
MTTTPPRGGRRRSTMTTATTKTTFTRLRTPFGDVRQPTAEECELVGRDTFYSEPYEGDHGESVTFKQARLAYVEHLELLARTGERSERSATAASARLKRLTRLDPLKLDTIGSPELAGAVRDLRASKHAAWSIKTTMQAFSACWTFSAREHGWCSEAARPILTTPVQITRENAR